MKKIPFVLLCLSCFLFSSFAIADVPPPNTEGCRSNKAGDACKNDAKKAGVCKKSKCSKLDYSNGTPPKTVRYDCLICEAETSQSRTDAGSRPDKGSSNPDSKGTAEKATSDGSENTKPVQSGCKSLAGEPLQAGFWFLFLTLALLFSRNFLRNRS